jgi:hypothetical protein
MDRRRWRQNLTTIGSLTAGQAARFPTRPCRISPAPHFGLSWRVAEMEMKFLVLACALDTKGRSGGVRAQHQNQPNDSALLRVFGRAISDDTKGQSSSTFMAGESWRLHANPGNVVKPRRNGTAAPTCFDS